MFNVLELIFFLSIALLGIVITLFVLAVSLLGRAISVSTKEQIAAQEQLQLSNSQEISRIKQQLSQAEESNTLNSGELRKTVEQLETLESKFTRALLWIKFKPKLLTVNFGALIPGISFLLAIVFCILTIYSFDSVNETYPVVYFRLSIIFLALGILFIYLVLKSIESTAIASDDTAFVREAQAIKAALKEIEIEQSPELSLDFLPVKPPFEITAGSIRELVFILQLIKGQYLEQPSVKFIAPPNFEFPDTNSWKQPDYLDSYPNYITCEKTTTKDIQGHIYSPGSLKIKAPLEKNTYEIYYHLVAKGYSKQIESFEIKVI